MFFDIQWMLKILDQIKYCSMKRKWFNIELNTNLFMPSHLMLVESNGND